MQKNNAINSLVVGILATFMLYSVNLQILERPNVSLLGKPTILSIVNINNWVIPLLIIATLLIISLLALLNSNFGLT